MRRWIMAAAITAGASWGAESASPQDVALAKIREHIPPLSHALGGRIPILAWQGRGFPTGLEKGNIEACQAAFVERGFLPLCNGCSSPEGVLLYLPILKYWQSRGMPVCILPQGWLQVPFVVDRKTRQPRCAHQPPASREHAYPCPAMMIESGLLPPEKQRLTQTLAALKANGIDLKLLCIDFEAGTYLRNTDETEDRVRAHMAEALKCPRCVARFGADALASVPEFVGIVDRVRAECTRTTLAEPLRSIFPDAHFGNFYAWPINRVPRSAGRWPAYGFENSGMTVFMPRRYMNAGWAGAGRDQDKMNWNVLRCCLEDFSPVASVRREGELLIPWFHVWLGGTYLEFVTKRGRALPEPWAIAEMVCHMMLRGAETLAIWMDAQLGEFPEDYPHPQYAEMGQFVYDLKGVQQGFDEMLAFNAFLRQAKSMTFEVFGAKAELGPLTATWSGMQTDEKALVRTVAFNGDETVTKTIRAFSRDVALEFGPRGRNWWVYPDGRVETAE